MELGLEELSRRQQYKWYVLSLSANRYQVLYSKIDSMDFLGWTTVFPIVSVIDQSVHNLYFRDIKPLQRTYES